MQKKTFVMLFIVLSVIAGCNKAHETTGIITQETDSAESQRMAGGGEMAYSCRWSRRCREQKTPCPAEKREKETTGFLVQLL